MARPELCGKHLAMLGHVAALVLGCGTSDERGAVPAESAETARLFWVSPAHCLVPCTYQPSDLVRIDDEGTIAPEGRHQFAAHAQPALAALLAAARSDGHAILADSGFRTYAEQLQLFLDATEVGRAARPGHSEHQIGTTMDFAYAADDDAVWLAERAREFGFALSYPNHKQKLTGFRNEPWHFRYVGVEAAEEIAQRGWAIEEYFHAYPERGRFGDCLDCPDPASRAACDGVNADGECTGTILGFCLDGSLVRVDCAPSGLVCTLAGAGADCQ